MIFESKSLGPFHLWEIVPFFGYRTVTFFEVTVTVFEPVFWPFSCLTANCTAPKTDHCHFFLNKRKPYHINIAIVSHLWLAPRTAPYQLWWSNDPNVDVVRFALILKKMAMVRFWCGAGKIKSKINYHRISTKNQFSRLKIYFIRKKNVDQFWSKFAAPPKLRHIEYHRVSLLVLTILCKTKWLFVAAAFKIKTFIIQIFDFNFSVCEDSKIFNKIPFLIPYNFKSHDEIQVKEKIK